MLGAVRDESESCRPAWHERSDARCACVMWTRCDAPHLGIDALAPAEPSACIRIFSVSFVQAAKVLRVNPECKVLTGVFSFKELLKRVPKGVAFDEALEAAARGEQGTVVGAAQGALRFGDDRVRVLDPWPELKLRPGATLLLLQPPLILLKAQLQTLDD